MMNTQIALQIDGEWAYLPDDVSISVEMYSPLWNDSGDITYEFELPVSRNLHIIGSVGEGHGDNAYRSLEGKRARLYAGGIPFFFGTILLDDEVETGPESDSIPISIVGGNLDFDEIIGNMKARDLELKKRMKIGRCLSDASVDFTIIGRNGHTGDVGIYSDTTVIHDLPITSTLLWDSSSYNVSLPYPAKAYCNARVCWQKYVWVGDNKQATSEYEVLDADKRGAGVNFYMLYFLESLFLHFDIPVLENGLLKRDELCRVAMMNTSCSFDADGEAGRVPESQAESFGYLWSGGMCAGNPYIEDDGLIAGENYESYGIDVDSVEFTAKNAYLNAGNFPDKTCKEILQAIEDGFCVRHVFDSRKGTVKLYLMDDVLRDESEERLQMEVHDKVKVENGIMGYRLAYSREDLDSDEKKGEQKYGDGDGVDYAFAHFSFDEVSNIDYASARKVISTFQGYDVTMYYDPSTGNAYRVIVDKNATSVETLYPTLMEVSQFSHVDYGDCSRQERTHTVTIGFDPVVLNDVNYRKSIDKGDREQILAWFLDGIGEKMLAREWSDRVASYENVNLDPSYDFLTYASVGLTFRLPVAYDLTASDEGDPLSSYNCGLTFGIMRGPGADGGVTDYEENYDGEGNWKWQQVPGNYAMTSDTCDSFGQIFDYNGNEAGMGGDISKRFSLKLRAEKYRKVKDEDTGEEREEALPLTNTALQKRGLFDHLHALFAHWVVNRRIMRFTGKMELSEVLSIDWTRKYRILDYYGFVNKVSYSIGSDGMSEVTIELYYL